MKRILMTMTVAASLIACARQGSSGSEQDNPLLVVSPLDYQAPQFDKIKPEHFAPAFKQGIAEHLAEIDSIANNVEAPTFENTLVPLQQAGRTLARTSAIFSALASADATDEIQRIEEEMRPLLSEHDDAVVLNSKLFARIKTIYDQELSKLTGEDKRLLEETYQDFVSSGANLSLEDKNKLKSLNAELAQLTNRFGNLIREAINTSALLVTSKDSLEGLSEELLAQAASEAKDMGKDGQYLLGQQNSTRSPFLAELDSKTLRSQLLERSMMRCQDGGKDDTQQLVLCITRLRAEKARLLGYPDYATYALQDQMAGSPQRVSVFLEKLIAAYRPKAEQDTRELEAYAKEISGADTQLEASDWDYYAEKLRKHKYDLNDGDLKPYFPLDSVLKNGVFYAAEQLYGISFKERHDLPVYADNVKVFEVFDQDGSPMALFYTDYYRRPTKSGGAWMSNFVEQSRLLGTKPVVYNVCNFAPPVGGQPTLLTMDEVSTMFHEFGHALHGIFSNAKYEALSGTNVPRDFVEMPSQLNEHWATDSLVLAHYARHYKTGEPIPQALVDKLKAASHFNQAYALGEVLGSVVLDLDWHLLTPESKVGSVSEQEQTTAQKWGLLSKQIPPRYLSTYFSHSMEGGYSAGYYAYLWAEVIDNNIFDWFVAHGGLRRDNGDRLRQLILSRGNTEDLMGLFEQLTGLKEPKVESLMRARGL